MRVQFLLLVSLFCAVAMARVDTAEVCTGAQSCDAGYCCSSHGFCGRSPLHCSHSSGCNPAKGSCGVVFLDKQELPHVVPYEELDQKAVPELINKLTNEGLHVSPEEKTGGMTMETIVNKGLAEKEKMPATAKPAAAPVSPAPALAPNAAHPLDPTAIDDKKTTAGEKKTMADDKKTTADDKIKTPETDKMAAPVEKANSANRLTVGVLGVTFGILPWIL